MFPIWLNQFNVKLQNYMELNGKPEMKKNLHKERMYFWDKMLWKNVEHMAEKKDLYIKATKFLLNSYI